ncbi:MAG: bifunctional (p)ppGpp synthetase/guanosine-3',5'-bis(diphosphate) 3'-pyrophosphohydrolase [Proteobacteria bacterium]|nr:bifunctional (p)ppGpp synthetase/guanosine-3',5'-bis(diphosphate) 3'-pyrophosphohydrolase [Pseudomonadota bacterium]
MSLVERAAEYAEKAHKGQKRKYTGEPYINHCITVSELVKSVDHTDEMLAAALLHDTVEDTEIAIMDIYFDFGEPICSYVAGLTDVSTLADGNRAARKKIDRDHYINSSPEVQTIKLADLIDNSKSIVERDPEFAKVYMKEKEALLGVLTEGDPELYRQAMYIVERYFIKQH